MKSIVIALKDLKQSFRSAFALAFMFGVPLLMTAMFFLMFGSQSSQPEAAFQPPVTHVVVVNLDQSDETLALGISASVPDHEIASLGDALVSSLQAPGLSDVMIVDEVDSEAAAKQRVDEKSAGAALIIPADFSADYASGKETAVVRLYHDPTETIGPGIVKSVVGQVVDSFSGVRIAVQTAVANLPPGSDVISESAAAAQQYSAFTAAAQNPAGLIELKPLVRAGDAGEQGGSVANIIAPIMGGMMIFFAFFTAGSTAQSILQEDEQGTLARLFTTATRYSTILSGKYLAVGLTVLVQVIVLLAASNLIFHIQWGNLAGVALAASGIIALAAAFGIFLTSLMKSTRQGGTVYGGFLTVTGMLGMLPIFTGGGGLMDMISLATPQGWAVRGLTLAMKGANLPDIAVNTMVMIVLSGVFMAVGVWKFQRRFA